MSLEKSSELFGDYNFFVSRPYDFDEYEIAGFIFELKRHSYAYQWFIETISDAPDYRDIGFNFEKADSWSKRAGSWGDARTPKPKEFAGVIRGSTIELLDQGKGLPGWRYGYRIQAQNLSEEISATRRLWERTAFTIDYKLNVTSIPDEIFSGKTLLKASARNDADNFSVNFKELVADDVLKSYDWMMRRLGGQSHIAWLVDLEGLKKVSAEANYTDWDNATVTELAQVLDAGAVDYFVREVGQFKIANDACRTVIMPGANTVLEVTPSFGIDLFGSDRPLVSIDEEGNPIRRDVLLVLSTGYVNLPQSKDLIGENQTGIDIYPEDNFVIKRVTVNSPEIKAIISLAPKRKSASPKSARLLAATPPTLSANALKSGEVVQVMADENGSWSINLDASESYTTDDEDEIAINRFELLDMAGKQGTAAMRMTDFGSGNDYQALDFPYVTVHGQLPMSTDADGNLVCEGERYTVQLTVMSSDDEDDVTTCVLDVRRPMPSDPSPSNPGSGDVGTIRDNRTTCWYSTRVGWTYWCGWYPVYGYRKYFKYGPCSSGSPLSSTVSDNWGGGGGGGGSSGTPSRTDSTGGSSGTGSFSSSGRPSFTIRYNDCNKLTAHETHIANYDTHSRPYVAGSAYRQTAAGFGARSAQSAATLAAASAETLATLSAAADSAIAAAGLIPGEGWFPSVSSLLHGLAADGDSSAAGFESALAVFNSENTAVEDWLTEFLGSASWLSLSCDALRGFVTNALALADADFLLPSDEVAALAPAGIAAADARRFAERWNATAAALADGTYSEDPEAAPGASATIRLSRGESFTATVTALKLDISVLDEEGNECKDLFEVFANGVAGAMSGGEDVLAGGLSVAAGGTGSAMVRFIPERGAAPTEAKVYRFGGTVTYVDPFSGETATVNLTPVSLTVSPSPYLHLDYFVQRDVYADDPFTLDVVEASMPAELSILIRNLGGGAARDVSISSMQPETVRNEKGLLASFKLTDYSNIRSAVDGLTANVGLSDILLGDLASGASKVVQRWLTSSIEGHFTGMASTVAPLNSWNTPDTALVDPEVGVHKLIRSIVADGDTLPDFLVSEDGDLYGRPDAIFTASGDMFDVHVATATCAALPNGAEIALSVTLAPARSGWCYGTAVIPGLFRYTITGITRADGTEVPLRNAWITDRTFRDGLTPLLEERLHIVDDFASDEAVPYTIALVAKPTDGPAVEAFDGIADGVVENTARDTVTVVFSTAVDPATFTADDLSLVHQGAFVADLSSLTVAPESGDGTGTRFVISGLAALCPNPGRSELTVQCVGIANLSGSPGLAGRSIAWTFSAPAVPYVVAIEGVPAECVQSLDTVTVVLSASIDPATFTSAALRIDDAAVGAGVTIRALDENGTRFAIEGLATEPAADGVHMLAVNATAFAAADGTAGVAGGNDTVSWTIDRTAPVLQSLVRSNELGEKFVLTFSELVNVADITVGRFSLACGGAPVALPVSALTAPVSANGGLASQFTLAGITSASLPDGDYTLSFSAAGVRDEAGNTATGSASVSWVVDNTRPEPAADLRISPDGGHSDTDGVTYTTALTVAGTLPEEGLSVEILARYGGGETVLAAFDGGSGTPHPTFSRDVVLPSDGNVALVVRLTDAAGNFSETTMAVFIDAIALTATLSGAPEDEGTPADTITLAFADAVASPDVSLARFSLTRNGEAVALGGATLAAAGGSPGGLAPPSATSVFTLSGLASLCSEDGYYVLSFNGAGVRKHSSGLAMDGSPVTLAWRYVNPDREPPTVTTVLFDGEAPHGAYTNGCMFTTASVAFSEPVNVPDLIANSLIGRAARIDLLDSADCVTGSVTAATAMAWDAESNTLSWSIDQAAVPAGRARLILDAGLIADLAGNHLAADGYSSASGLRAYTPGETVLAQVNAYAIPTWHGGALYVGEKTADGKGKIRHYAANGTWSYLQSGGADIEVQAQGCQGAAVAFADMDGDGAEETYVGTAAGDILRYPGGEHAVSLGTQRAIPFAFDFDGDGRDELIAGGMDGRIRVVSRDAATGDYGLTLLSDAGGVPLAVPNGRAAPVVADINHDGLADIVSGDTAGNVWAFLGEGTAWRAQPVSVLANDGGLADRSRLAYGDVDGDGIEDLIVGRSDGSATMMAGAETPSPIVGFAVKAVITATTGGHGAIAPAGDSTYDGGDTPEYTITPDVGYHVDDVLVDGVSIGAVGSYVFAPLTASHTIGAEFALDAFAVSFLPGAHGSLTGETAQTVDYGATASVPEVTPDAGYAFAGWDGDVSAPVTGGVTFTAQYAAIRYAITYMDLKGASNPNPATYTVEDAITFAAPGEVYGWVFQGWTPASVAVGTTGDIEVAATWERPAITLAQALDATNLVWTTGGGAEWTPEWNENAPVGGAFAHSGEIGNDTTTWVETSLAGKGTLSFKWRISCENRYDYAIVEVDGTTRSRITGESGWAEAAYDLDWGDHVVRWTYRKGRSGSGGEDTLWLDAVSWMPQALPTLPVALGATNLVWTTTGDEPWRVLGGGDAWDGEACAVSGAIGDYGVSTLSTIIVGPGRLSFRWSVSCEDGCDWFDFLVDGNLVDTVTGESGWTLVTYEIPEGLHEVTWEYWKDEMDEDGMVGFDRALLDDVSFTPTDGATPLADPDFARIEFRDALVSAGLLSADASTEAFNAAAQSDVDGDGYTAWDEFVAGTDPRDFDSVLIALIDIDADGNPVISWRPDLNEGGKKQLRKYTVEGKAKLSDEWGAVDDKCRFFRVKAEMP